MSWLDTVHPKYATAAKHWVFCRQSYEGGAGYFAPNLIRHEKEFEDDFRIRLAKACRYNFTAQSVGIVTGHLLKNTPVRKAEAVSEGVRRFWGRSTQDGDDMDTFARELSNWSSVYGRLYVVIDVPSADGIEPATELERQQRGLEPYAYTVAPDDVLDLAYDSKGALLWVKVLERYREDSDPRTASPTMSDRFRLWERGRWSLWEKGKDTQGKDTEVMVAEGMVPFSDIPVVVVEHKDGDQYMSPGLVDDLVYLDRSIFNLMSELDETISSQTFGQLAIPSDAIADDATNATIIHMGKKAIFTYDAAASHPPFYLSPDSSQGGLVLEAIKERCHQAHDSVNLGDEVGGARSQSSAQSGVSKAYSFAKLESGLAVKAGELEEAELAIARVVDLWNGGTGEIPAGAICYEKRFDVISLQQALTDAMSVEALLGGSSPSAVAEMRKMAVQKVLEGADDATLEIISKEIDIWAAQELKEPHEDEELEHDPTIRPGYYQLAAKEPDGDEAGAMGKTAA